MEVDTVLSDFESSDFGEMVRNDGNQSDQFNKFTPNTKTVLTSKRMVKQWSVIFLMTSLLWRVHRD